MSGNQKRTDTDGVSPIRKDGGLSRLDTSRSSASTPSVPPYMTGNIKPHQLPIYTWEPIEDPIAQPDRAWTIKRGGVSVAWAFERDQTGMGHGWCVQIGTCEVSGVAMNFERAKQKAELALDRLTMDAIIAAIRMIP